MTSLCALNGVMIFSAVLVFYCAGRARINASIGLVFRYLWNFLFLEFCAWEFNYTNLWFVSTHMF